jgi:hypothetical protein
MRTLSAQEIEQVFGGWKNGEPPGQNKQKCNNGWGNGGEGCAPGRSLDSAVGDKFTDPGSPGAQSSSPNADGDR